MATVTELLTQDFNSFIGKPRYRRKLSAKQRHEIYRLYKTGTSQLQLAKDFKVSRTTIQNVLRESRIPIGLKDTYWCGATEKKWAEEAKRKYLYLSEKYRGNNGKVGNY